MPANKLDWRASDAKRLLRAVRSQGLANRLTSISKHPDGTLTISLAPPRPAELSPDVDRDADEIVNEWDKTYGSKPKK